MLPNLLKLDAGFGLGVAKEGAFIVKIPISYEHSLEDMKQLEKQIINHINKEGEEKWDLKYAVIVSIVKAPSATIAISQSANSRTEFSIESI